MSTPNQTNIMHDTSALDSSSNMSYSQHIQQQQIDASPISSQLNKVLKKAKKDTEKKMLLTDEDFN